MKKLLLLALTLVSSLSAAPPGGNIGIAAQPSGDPAFLHVDANGALLLAGSGPNIGADPGGNVGVALDPNGIISFLHVDANGGLIVSGGGSGPIVSSGYTESTATMLGRTSAGTGAIQELSGSAVRTFAGVVIGTNVQAWSANLDTWSGKTPYVGTLTITSGKTIAFSNNLTFVGTDGTTITYPSTSATVARIDAPNTFVGVQNFSNLSVASSTLTYAATTTIDFSGDGFKTETLTGDVTYASSNLANGRSVTIRIVPGGSARTPTFPGGWTFIGAAAPTTIASGKTAVLTLTSFGTTDADVVAAYGVVP